MWAIITAVHGPVLDADLRALLQQHQSEVLDVMLAAAGAYAGGPLRRTAEGRRLLALDRRGLVSVALSAAAAAVAGPHPEQVVADGRYRVRASDFFVSVVLDWLRRRRLPFTADEVRLLLVMGTHPFEDRVLSVGVLAAGRYLEEQPGHAGFLDALEEAAAALDDLPSTRYGVVALRRKVGTLLAAGVRDLAEPHA